MELAGSNLTEDQLEDMLDKGEGAQLVGHVHIEGDADQLRQTINDIENRHEMFISLEKSITELHDMFIDIATLIESQGEMVNRIGKFCSLKYVTLQRWTISFCQFLQSLISAVHPYT